MANELTTEKDNAPLSETAKMFALVIEAARDPNVDAGKMTSLVDLQMKMMDYSKQEELSQRSMNNICLRYCFRSLVGQVLFIG